MAYVVSPTIACITLVSMKNCLFCDFSEAFELKSYRIESVYSVYSAKAYDLSSHSQLNTQKFVIQLSRGFD